MKAAVFYEHPEWNALLFQGLERRGIRVEKLDASIEIPEPRGEWDVVLNRMSASAWTRGNGEAMISAEAFLEGVESLGTPVINGSRALRYEVSKTRQEELFVSEGLAHPRTVAVAGVEEVAAASAGLAFPVLIKPDAGGSGAGIVAFERSTDLQAALKAESVDLGPSGRGIVQERIPVSDGVVTRLEILDGELLYAIQMGLRPDSFNMCPAEYCVTEKSPQSSERVERVDPPAELVESACRVISTAGADVGSMEYLVDSRDGEARFIDLNVNSNFLADATQVLGFDPWERFVDYVIARGSVQTSIEPSRTTTSS